MTDDKIHKDDLGDFLRSHAPRAPEAPPSLESSLLRAIHGDENEQSGWKRFRRGGIFAAMIIAATVLAWIVTPDDENASAQLENYMESSWEGAMVSDQDLGHESMLAELDRAF